MEICSRYWYFLYFKCWCWVWTTISHSGIKGQWLIQSLGQELTMHLNNICWSYFQYDFPLVFSQGRYVPYIKPLLQISIFPIFPIFHSLLGLHCSLWIVVSRITISRCSSMLHSPYLSKLLKPQSRQQDSFKTRFEEMKTETQP